MFNAVPPTVWYRILVQSANGKKVYSNIQLVHAKNATDIKVLPNPVTSYLKIILPYSTLTVAEISILNTHGANIYQKLTEVHNSAINLIVPVGWPSGTYIILVKQGEMIYRKRIVIQR